MKLIDLKDETKVRTKIIGMLVTTGEDKLLVNKFDSVVTLKNEGMTDTDELRDHIAIELTKSEVFAILADGKAVNIHPKQFATLEVQVTVVPSEL